MMSWGWCRRAATRNEVGTRLMAGWEAVELCIAAAAKVHTGKGLQIEGDDDGLNLHQMFFAAEDGGWINAKHVQKLLGVRQDYIGRRYPETKVMERAANDLWALEGQLRERLGPLAPPRPKPVKALPPL